jgi:hypothetical protein
MILLQSKDRFDSLAELDVTTGAVSWISRSGVGEVAWEEIYGSFSCLAGRLVMLYRLEGVLRLRIDELTFLLTGIHSLDRMLLGENMARLTLFEGDTSIFSMTYRRPEVFPPLALDPTPFVEEEDFDFGLFLYNVLNDPGRRARIYGRC